MAPNRPKNRRKPLGFSKTVVTEFLAPAALPQSARRLKRGDVGGRPSPLKVGPSLGDGGKLAPVVALHAAGGRARRTPAMAGLVREWLEELKVMNRSPQTLKWYRQKMDWYLEHESGPSTLDELTSPEVKRLLGALIGRGLSANTVHGFFEVVRAFANWALREGFAVDPAVIRMRPPKVPITELETYNSAEQEALIAGAAPGWPRLAVQILLGTGMRVGELAALSATSKTTARWAFSKSVKARAPSFVGCHSPAGCNERLGATSTARGRKDQRIGSS